MAARTLQTGPVPVIMRIRIAQTSKPYLTHKLLVVAFCLGSATLFADPLPHLQRIRVDLSEFAVSPAPFPASGISRREVRAGLGSTTSRGTKQSAALIGTAWANSTAYYLTVQRVPSARLLLPHRSPPMNGRLAYCWSDWVVLRAAKKVTILSGV